MPIRFPREEDEAQARLVADLRINGVLFCHVPNEGRISKRAAVIRRALGVERGVPDILIFSPPVLSSGLRFAGAALELKILPNTPTEDQARWLHGLHLSGWLVAVISGRTADEVVLRGRQQLTTWGYLPSH